MLQESYGNIPLGSQSPNPGMTADAQDLEGLATYGGLATF